MSFIFPQRYADEKEDGKHNNIVIPTNTVLKTEISQRLHIIRMLTQVYNTILHVLYLHKEYRTKESIRNWKQ